MSSLPFDGSTTVAVVALTQTDCKQFYHSRRRDAQCRIGNRKCCTVPGTELNRAAIEIALPYTCGAESRAAGVVLSNHCALACRLQGPRPGGGGGCAARARLPSLLSFPAIASSAGCLLGRHPTAVYASRVHRCRQGKGSRRHTPSGRAPLAPSTNG